MKRLAAICALTMLVVACEAKSPLVLTQCLPEGNPDVRRYS